jgi:hypothetical protein
MRDILVNTSDVCVLGEADYSNGKYIFMMTANGGGETMKFWTKVLYIVVKQPNNSRNISLAYHDYNVTYS